MPMYRFWSASKNADRIRADEKLLDLRVQNAAGSKESSEAMFEELGKARGTVVVVDQVKPEKDAFDRLRRALGG